MRRIKTHWMGKAQIHCTECGRMQTVRVTGNSKGVAIIHLVRGKN
jgi:hypothetical protein